MIHCPHCGGVFDPAALGRRGPSPGTAARIEGHQFLGRYKRPAGCTDERECQVLSLAGVWSAKVRRLTVLNRERFVAIHARLEDGYSYAALRAAIEKYGADEWHRRTGAWLDLADFMRPKNLDKWFVECAERERVAEQKQAQRTPLAPPVRGVVREVAKALKAPTPADEERARIAEFKAMPEAERAAVLDQAAREWAGLHPQRNPLPADLAYYPIARQVCEILKRRKAGEARPP